MVMRGRTLFLGLLLALAGVGLAFREVAADEAATINQWYQALGKADGEALAKLLAVNAVVKLDDIGVSQTKAEFAASMNEWKQAIVGGTIRHKPDGTAGTSAYKVCYHFAKNDLLTREVFKTENGLIVESQQQKIAENCDGF